VLTGKRGALIINSVLIFCNAGATSWNLIPPHLWPRRPLYAVLKRKACKKNIQKAHTATRSQAEAGDQSLSTGESPRTHPLQGHCHLHVTDSGSRPSNFLRLFLIKFSRALTFFYTETDRKHPSCLGGNTFT